MPTCSAPVALSILEIVSRQSEPVPVKDIPALAGISKASAYRGVQYLVKDRWISLAGSPQVATPTMRVAALGLTSLRYDPVHAALVPFAIDLTRETGWTCILTHYEDGELVCSFSLDRVAGRVSCTPSGARAPAACTAAGKVVLAHRPALERDEVIARGVPKLAPETRTLPAEIAEEVRLSGERGYGLCFEELVKGACAVGAAVFDSSGFAVAGISVGFRVPAPHGFPERMIEPLTTASEKASLRLGYRPPRPLEGG